MRSEATKNGNVIVLSPDDVHSITDKENEEDEYH